MDRVNGDNIRIIDNTENISVLEHEYGKWGTYFLYLTRADIDALLNNKVIFYGQGEYSTIIQMFNDTEDKSK